MRGTIVHRLLESLDFLPAAAPSAEDVAGVARELGVRVAPDEREELAALLRAALDTPLAARLAAVAPGARREHPFALALAAPRRRSRSIPSPPSRRSSTRPRSTHRSSRGPIGCSSPACSTSSPASPTAACWSSTTRAIASPPARISSRWSSASTRSSACSTPLRCSPTARRASRSSTGSCTVPPSRSVPCSPQGDRPRLEEAIAGLARNARGGSFTVSEDPHRGLCLTCPGRSGMCSWSDSMTLRERGGTVS